MKIIKNNCFGGYGLSLEAKLEIAKKKGKKLYFFDFKNNSIKPEDAKDQLFVIDYTVPNPYELGIDKADKDGLYTTANKIAEEISIDWDNRTDPDIIEVVEKLGEKSWGRFSKLEVVEIPDDVEYEIDEYDGLETIREVHRTW